MEPIDFQTALKFFEEKEYEIPTLGWKSYIVVSKVKNELLITDNTGASKTITQLQWDQVVERMDGLSLEQRHVVSMYTSPKWSEAFDKNFAPHIPAIARFILLNED